MKKILTAIILCLSLLGCTSNQEAKVESHKILVVYFSATNHTKEVAENIAQILDANIVELEPVNEYTEDDLNYNDSSSRTSIEQNDDSMRVEIKNTINIDSYDTILIGHPIWWGKAPKIIYTFLESYDFSNKNISTFCTSSSSGLGNSAELLKEITNGSNITWLESHRFEIGASQDEIENWLKDIQLY